MRIWASVLFLCKGSIQLSAGRVCPGVPHKCLRIVCMSPWAYTRVSWTWCGKVLIECIFFWQVFKVINELESNLGIYITWNLLVLRVLSHFFKERSPLQLLLWLSKTRCLDTVSKPAKPFHFPKPEHTLFVSAFESQIKCKNRNGWKIVFF